jgi:alkenylglycerophosphocholine/alkenylglycerophosphoethanolamine hydrolase
VTRLRPGPVLLLAALAAAAAFFLGLAHDLPAVRLWTKPVPAVVLATWVVVRRADAGGRLVVAGLVASAVGDVLLERGLFLPGLVAFLAAHVGYCAGFLTETRRLALGRAVPVLAWCVGVLALLWPGLGDLALPVAAYVAVIGAMIWRAAARVGQAGRPTRAEWIGLAGATSFVLSDTLIALDRFVAPIPGARWPIMLLYWAGQWGIAASVGGAPEEG